MNRIICIGNRYVKADSAGPCVYDELALKENLPEDVASTAESHYDHSVGIGYLLKILPEVCEQNLPEVIIVGIEGDPDRHKIQKAAELVLKMII